MKNIARKPLIYVFNVTSFIIFCDLISLIHMDFLKIHQYTSLNKISETDLKQQRFCFQRGII